MKLSTATKVLFMSVRKLVQSQETVPISSIAEDIDNTPNPLCNNIEIDFIVQDGNPEMAAVEDDIVRNLAEIGIKVLLTLVIIFIAN